MNRLKKPIIINLAEYLSKTADKPSPSVRSNNTSKAITKLPHGNEKPSMTSEMDAEMQNDFQWLINFNIKKILRSAIDEEFSSHEQFEEEEFSISKENCDRHNTITLIDIIKECLTEKKEATIRYIYKWIKNKFPCFRTEECKWKNFVRESLLQNPIFKKKRSKSVKSDLWYLDKICLKDSKCIIHNLQQNKESTVSKGNSIKSRKFRKPRSTRKPISTLIPFKECNDGLYRTETNNSSTSNVHLCPLTAWIQQTEFQGKNLNSSEEVKQELPSEYYEMELPLQTEFLVENTESMEVLNYLDENTPISLDLL